MSLFADLQVLALREVLLDTPGFQLREAYRWYARTYGLTPLKAMELPEPHVLQEFYEYTYSQMLPEEREEARQQLLETREERNRRLDAEALQKIQRKSSDDDFEAMTLKAALEQQQKAKGEITPVAPASPIPGTTIPETPLVAETSIPVVKPLPNVRMMFATDEDFEARLNRTPEGEAR